MKYLKFLAVALCAVGFTSCGDFDFTPDAPKINTLSGVTVSLEDAEISFFENKGIVKVPFKVTGERNGDITVECTVMEVPETPATEPAIESAHYIFTQKSIIVSKDDDSGVFEIRLFNDKEINADRQFEVKLTNTQGCSVSGIDETVVTIKDDDSDPYVRLGGAWTITLANGSTVPGVMFNAYDEGEEGYYRYYSVTGIFTDQKSNPVEIIAKFDYNKTTKEGKVVFEYGQDLPSYTHSSYGVGTGLFGYVTADGYIGDDGAANFTWNETGTELSLESWAGQAGYDTWGCNFYYFLHFDAGWMLYDNIDDIVGFKRSE